MPKKFACLALFLAIVLTGCAATNTPNAPTAAGSTPDNPLTAETIELSDISLSPFPGFVTNGWGWQISPSATSSKRTMRVAFVDTDIPRLSSSYPKNRGVALQIPSDAGVAATDITSSTITLSLTTDKTRLPIYSSYLNETQLHIQITAVTENHRSPCTDPFEMGYPFIMSSLRFEKTQAVTINDVPFDHAQETMRSRESSTTWDFYRTEHNGLCLRIMKTVDTGGVKADLREAIKRDISDLLASIRFF